MGYPSVRDGLIDREDWSSRSEYTGYNSKIMPEIAHQIREIAASTPPDGKKKWSSRMLCAEVEKRGILEHIVSSTVCKILREEV